MYDICGERSDGKVLNCPYGSPSVKPDGLFSAKIQSLCPTISGSVCCTELEFETLRAQVQQAIPLCRRLSSMLEELPKSILVSGNMTVDGIDFYISDTFGKGLYNSCKDVKFGTMNTRAIEFIGAGAKNFKEWFDFLGEKAAPGFPGSPYAIDFKLTVPESSSMELMNVSVYSCADTSLGCSCGDCPSSPACSNPEPPPHKKELCSITILSIEVKCIDFSVAILYILLVSAFVGWFLFHRKKKGELDLVRQHC